MKKTILFLLAAVAVIILCSSCGVKYEETEIRAAVEDLIPKSVELNVIYFGEGLPISDDRELVEEFYGSFESDITAINYHPVSKDCPYQTEEDLRNATLEVFTEDYAEYLFQRAFSGISGQLENIQGETVTHSAIYAMYIEENGVLTVRLDISKDALPLNREYRIEDMTVKSQRRGVVTVEIPTYVDGQLDLVVDVRLVMTENGWRLDSPTY